MHLNHPILPSVQPDWQTELLRHQQNNQPFSCRSNTMPNHVIEPHALSVLPPWLIEAPKVSTELSKVITKEDLPAHLYQRSLECIGKKWPNALHVYTDGSKIPGKGISASSFYVYLPFLIINLNDYATIHPPFEPNWPPLFLPLIG